MHRATQLTTLIAATVLVGVGLLHPLPPFTSATPATDSGLSQGDVYVSGTNGYHTYRIPSLIVTRKGTLLAFCEGRRNGRSDSGEIDLLVKRSKDGGRTWSSQIVVWHDGHNTCGNPCPVVDDATGTIWLLLSHNLGEDVEDDIDRRQAHGTRTAWVCKSTDDGLTWSKPVDITSAVKSSDWGWYASGPGVGIQLHQGPHPGRLLVPINFTTQPYLARPDEPAYGDAVIYSDDHGASWHLGGVVPSFKVDEDQIVELADGTIMMNSRDHWGTGQRVVSISDDGGDSWTPAELDQTLIEPDCQGSFIRMTEEPACGKNRLLFSNPASTTARVNMTVRLSYDEGKTWPVARQIFAGKAAYSCLAVLPDGRIACLYERGEKDAYERITLARFSLEWLTSGADHFDCLQHPPFNKWPNKDVPKAP